MVDGTIGGGRRCPIISPYVPVVPTYLFNGGFQMVVGIMLSAGSLIAVKKTQIFIIRFKTNTVPRDALFFGKF